MTTPVGLRRGVRLVYDEARGQHALLQPEGVGLLNESAAAVLARCDGRSDVAAIAAGVAEEFDGVDPREIAELVDALLARRILQPGGAGVTGDVAPARPSPRPDPIPFGLLAELTYRCPLRCAYCSNPVELSGPGSELSTDAWRGVLDQARDLGVLQVHLSGGEPLARRDLAAQVAHARGLGLYTNLVTSGLGLSAARLTALAEAGLDHVQLSIQDADAAAANAMAGIAAHERKQASAALVREHGLPLSINVVLHRHNVDRLRQIARYAVGLGADRVELAHTQFYGWGLLNRAALLPTADQVSRAQADADAIHAEFGDAVEIVYVRPDYHDGVPKPCMNGWGSRQLVVTPTGDVWPCPAAQILGLPAASVATGSLHDIWYASAAFTRFRGTGWLGEPCRSCPRREVDFGGCRCQAYQLTGNAHATDPVCALSPDHHRVAELVAATAATPSIPLIPRVMR
ncbi:MAG: pyrroloquinoline quinone biosynthesis protein PqqE [Hamadaea sp.]|nr:pyrroloquinoline quinone biosynthesis protein PqqE [Hamadaea sp.]